MNKKPVKIIFALIVSAAVISGCCESEKSVAEPKESKNTYVSPAEGSFEIVERSSYYMIVYHKENKVMYVVSNSRNNYGTFTMLVNRNGSPMLYYEK